MTAQSKRTVLFTLFYAAVIIMMLFMFYSFPAALSLYWTVSQILAIVQMLLMRRHTHPPKKDDGIDDAEPR